MMSTLNLPEPIAAYFAADRLNPDAIAGCFTAHAVVKDEGRTHTGIDAIKAWKAAASTHTRTRLPRLRWNRKEAFRSSGVGSPATFPGSPVDLRYDFRLERGLIASLEITA